MINALEPAGIVQVPILCNNKYYNHQPAASRYQKSDRKHEKLLIIRHEIWSVSQFDTSVEPVFNL